MEQNVTKIARSVIVLLLAIGIAIALIKIKPKPQKLPPPPKSLLVEAIPVKASSLVMTVKSYGTIRPRETLNLVSEIKGKVVEIATNFEEGKFIRKDELLIRIDPSSYDLAVAQKKKQLKQIDAELRLLDQEQENLQITLKIVQADMELARAEWERFKTLVKQGVVAQSSLDQAQQKYLGSRNRMQDIRNQLALIGPRADRLRTQRELVEVQLSDALLDLDRTGIIAPFDGWVLEKGVEKGQFVNTGIPLGRIYNASTLEVEIHVPFQDLPLLFELHPPGNKSDPEERGLLAGPSIQAKVIFKRTGHTHTWDGQLARIKAEIDEKTRTLPLIIEVPTEGSTARAPYPYTLKPGMFVIVELIGRKVDKTYLLPRSAIHPGNLVYLVNDQHLAIRPVEVLQRLDDSVYVSKGLMDGDLVIITPISTPQEGMKLSLVNTEQAKGLQK